jgi:hypothetical protein
MMIKRITEEKYHKYFKLTASCHECCLRILQKITPIIAFYVTRQNFCHRHYFITQTLSTRDHFQNNDIIRTNENNEMFFSDMRFGPYSVSYNIINSHC